MAASLYVKLILIRVILLYFDSPFSQYPSDSRQGNQTTTDILGKTLILRL